MKYIKVIIMLPIAILGYDGLSIDDLKRSRDTFQNEFQTLEKHIRYSDELHKQVKEMVTE